MIYENEFFRENPEKGGNNNNRTKKVSGLFADYFQPLIEAQRRVL